MFKDDHKKTHKFEVDEKNLETQTLLDPTYKLQSYQTNFQPILFNLQEDYKIQEYDFEKEKEKPKELYPQLKEEKKFEETNKSSQQNLYQGNSIQPTVQNNQQGLQQQNTQQVLYPQFNQQNIQSQQVQYPQFTQQKVVQQNVQKNVQQNTQQNVQQNTQQIQQQSFQQNQVQQKKYTPFYHGNQIKLRSLYGFYLDYTKNGAPTSTFDGCIFTIEVKDNQLQFKHQFGYIVLNNTNTFDAIEIQKTGRYSLTASDKFLGISPEGNVANYKNNNLIDTHFIIEDLKVKNDYSVGPFKHGNWIILKNVANRGYFRYNLQDQPTTDLYSPMVFFVEALPNKKFRLYYWKGFVVCTLKNEFDFEVIEIPQSQKPPVYSLKTSKFLGVDPKRPGHVAIYDSCNYNESRWNVDLFNPKIYKVGDIHHRMQVKFRPYYYKNYYLTINLNAPLSLSQQGTIFTMYQLGNSFRIMANNLSLCTDHPSHNVFFVYCFEPKEVNGYAIGSGSPGKILFIGSAKDGKVGLYNHYKFAESRWFIEPIKLN